MAIYLSHALRATVRVRVSFRTLLMAGSMLAAGLPLTVAAQSVLPTGGTVQAGSAVISSSPGQTLISQSTKTAVIDWTSFSVGSGNTVQFNNGTGATLNRVTGSGISSIDGLVSATGSVYLLNGNGVIIGKTGVVKTGGSFVASTHDIGNPAFMAGGDLSLSGTSQAPVINLGQVSALGGDVVLAAVTVRNDGAITAPNGTVGLLGGQSFVLRDKALDDGKFLVLTSVPAGSVTNTGAITAAAAELRAEGGNVYALAGNTQGIIRATGVAARDGKVFLTAGEGGTVSVSGTDITARSSSGGAGFVETSAGSVRIADSASISTQGADGAFGTWLIDPVDFTVAASGGDMTGAALSSSLGSSNVTLLSSGGVSGTNGDININDAVTWSSNSALLLSAYRNINISQQITSNGATGRLSLVYGQGAVAAGNTANYYLTNSAGVYLHSGSNFSTRLGSNGATTGYTVITSLGAAGSVTGTDLQGINGNLAGNYVLGANIDATATSGWNAGAGFTPLGFTGDFKGIFDGLGHSITGLTVHRPSSSNVGLFGYSTGMIRNISLSGAITGIAYVGGLVGFNQGSVSYASSSATVNAGNNGAYIGGLIGYNLTHSPTTNVSASGAVTVGNGTFFDGGLIGSNAYSALSNVTASGNVTGGDNIQIAGGLVGENFVANINASSSSGTVSGSGTAEAFGGLVGENLGSLINNSFATGDVLTPHNGVSGTPGGTQIGGLVGASVNSGFTNDYATGMVSVGAYFSYVGGLIGDNTNGPVNTSYATGNVSTSGAGSTYFGGLIGRNVNSAVFMGHATGTVSSAGEATDFGGLIGYNYSGSIRWSYATGTVSSGDNGQFLGGLIGYNTGAIDNSYANGNITTTGTTGSLAGSYYGGLVGWNSGNVSNSHAKGNITLTPSSPVLASNNGYYGGLLGYNTGNVSNTYAAGAITAAEAGYVGGLIGESEGGTIDSASATGSITVADGSSNLGGLVGGMSGTLSNARAYSNIDVRTAMNNSVSTVQIGGLVGWYKSGAASNVFATGNITLAGYSRFGYVGGLIGVSNASVEAAFSAGNISTPNNVYDVFFGGLIGRIDGGTILNAYSNSNIIAGKDRYSEEFYFGGLIGYAEGTTITNTYSTGKISVYPTSEQIRLGGLIGYGPDISLTSSFWAKDQSGLTISSGGTGVGIEALHKVSTFAGWDLGTTGGTSTVWRIYPGQTMPLLRVFLKPLNISGVTGTVPYNGSVQTLVPTWPAGTQPTRILGAPPSGRDPGTYTGTYYSNQYGYDLTGQATLTIN